MANRIELCHQDINLEEVLVNGLSTHLDVLELTVESQPALCVPRLVGVCKVLLELSGIRLVVRNGS
jgi:hypothetical protein